MEDVRLLFADVQTQTSLRVPRLGGKLRWLVMDRVSGGTDFENARQVAHDAVGMLPAPELFVPTFATWPAPQLQPTPPAMLKLH